ncbi:MAG TPA: hypothetical protein VKX39_00620 [Bryobacteraceae bacterium]|nr:hypothetical protein [Bryobacteraceae bacterium]
MLAILPILLIGIAAQAETQDPALLQVRVVEGDGAVYPIGARATRGITVSVTDEIGRPVEGATVSFRLPDEGPGGTFSSGSRTEIATTRADGRAGVWGMQWNRTAGSFEIRITAVKGKTRAGTVTQQFLTDSPAARNLRAGLSRGHKWVWISLAVAGAAAGGIAATALGGKPGVPPPAASLQIGTPTISLGKP